MRIALLARSAYPLHPPGGMERAVYHLAVHLRAAGVETILYTRTATDDGAFPGDVQMLPYGSLLGVPHGRVLDRTLLYPAFAVRVGVAVAAAVRAGRIDVVDAQGLMALGYARLRHSDPSLRAPLLMNPQGMEEHKARGLKRLALSRLRMLSREAARLADRVVATDEATRDEVPLLLGVNASRVVVLPNGIDLDEIRRHTPEDSRATAEAIAPLAGAMPVLLSVGRLEGYKGFGDTLKALRRLDRDGDLPPRWAWVIAGDGPERKALARQAREWLGRHIHLVGRVTETDLHALYERADLFVHATHFEGSSLVTLEAMAHGLPVVATRAGGIPDKVRDGETGRLVEPGAIDALALALGPLLADGDLRRAMGTRGRERVEQWFAWSSLAARTIAVYEELLAARSS